MTQDQPGQAQGTDYVVRGEVVPDDETGALESEQSGPMTRLRKVASAMRGDRPDQTIPDQPGAMSNPPPEAEMGDGEYADATAPDDMGAVRSPEAGNGDYWDDGRATTAPDEGTIVSDPSMTGASTYGTTAPVRTTGVGSAAPTPGSGSEADTAAGYGSQAGTAAVSSDYPGNPPGHGSQAGTTHGVGSEAGTATGYGSRAGTATDPEELTGTGPAATEADITKGGPAGKHAAAAADAGLRPGEATDRIGDFGDIAFGNLLPDAAQYSAQWQQIQFRFVDDPQGSVTEAADVISQVTTKLEAAIQERQRAIEERQRAIQERASALRGRWGEGSNADTETLRETLRMYRAFMDQLVGPTA
jgi:hypothetical protein